MRILLAIDGSPCSDAAVAEVARRPWPEGTQFRLVTVVRLWTTESTRGGAPAVFTELNKQLREQALQRLQDATGILQSVASHKDISSLLREGLPKDIILEEAESWGADLIVVGSNGYGTIRRFLLGSVSLAVAAAAPCSVEIVRPPARPRMDPP